MKRKMKRKLIQSAIEKLARILGKSHFIVKIGNTYYGVADIDAK
jgi:hypothetical protein